MIKYILLLVSGIVYIIISTIYLHKNITLVIFLSLFFMIGITFLFKFIKYIFFSKRYKAIIIKQETTTYGDSPNPIYFYDIEYKKKDKLIRCKNKYGESRIAFIEKKLKEGNEISILVYNNNECDLIFVKSLFTYIYIAIMAIGVSLYYLGVL